MFSSEDFSPGSIGHPYTNGGGMRPGRGMLPNPNAPFNERDSLRLAALNHVPGSAPSRKLGRANTAANLGTIAHLGGMDLSAAVSLSAPPPMRVNTPAPSMTVRIRPRGR